MSEAGANGSAPAGVVTKPGRHREATLYRPLAGTGAGGKGFALAQLRERALAAYEASSLPVWRRSGFWSTSFEDLQLEELEIRHHPPTATALPDVVTRTLPGRDAGGHTRRAGWSSSMGRSSRSSSTRRWPSAG